MKIYNQNQYPKSPPAKISESVTVWMMFEDEWGGGYGEGYYDYDLKSWYWSNCQEMPDLKFKWVYPQDVFNQK